MSRVRAVLFDAADTLFYNRELQRRLSALGNGGDLRLESTFLYSCIATVGNRGLWPADSASRSQRLARWMDFYILALTEAGLARPEAVCYAEHLAEAVVEPSSYATFPDVEPVLTQLELAGVLTGIVSNFDTLLASILDHLDLSRRFPVVVTSYEVGCYKPDPRIFHVALHRLKVTPEETVFVGDSPYSDIGGALAAKITPVLVDRTGVRCGVECTTIADLRKLLDLV